MKAALSENDTAFGKLIADVGVAGRATSGPNASTATITQLKAGHYGLLCFVRRTRRRRRTSPTA